MGNNPIIPVTTTEQSINKVLEKLDFILEANSPHFGFFKVYKMREKPYEYLMCKTYTAMVGTETLQYKKQNYSRYGPHKSVIPFEYISLRQVEQKCSQHLQLNILCRYYFFTLEQAIQKKIKKQSKFPEEEILYTIKTLISLYDYFHEKENTDCELFRTNNIFLTPEGFLKVYPEINSWKQQKIEEGDSFANSIFSFAVENQVQLDLGKEKKEVFVKKEKSTNDILDIGVVILSIICSAKQSDYRIDNDTLRYQIIKFVLSSYYDPENKPLTIFKNLLKGIFQNGWTIQEIKAQIQQLQRNYQFKISNRIRIVNSENEESDLTISSQPFEKQRQSRLKMLPKNYLIPGRIECMSARTSCTSKI